MHSPHQRLEGDRVYSPPHRLEVDRVHSVLTGKRGTQSALPSSQASGHMAEPDQIKKW